VVNIEPVDDRAPALQTQVASAEYEVTLTEPADASELKRKIEAMIAATSLPRERRGKTYDLRPLVETIDILDNQKIFMRLAAREGATGRPEEVLDVLGIAFEGTHIERTRLLFQS
jgi:hypothetical protein